MGKIVYHLKEVKAGMLSKQNNLKDERDSPPRGGMNLEIRRSSRGDQAECKAVQEDSCE